MHLRNTTRNAINFSCETIGIVGPKLLLMRLLLHSRQQITCGRMFFGFARQIRHIECRVLLRRERGHRAGVTPSLAAGSQPQ